MTAQHRRVLSACLLVILGLIALAFLATSAQTWAAPPSQGTVKPPTPVGPPEPGGGLPPNVSPSGCCLPGVAFSSNRDGNEEIYVMTADGSKMLRLTNNDGIIDRHPATSPDGTKIAFVSNRDDPDPKTCGTPGHPNCIFNIYVMNVDGTGLYRLTNSNGADVNPYWGFVDGWIVFQSTRDDPSPLTCGQPGKPNCIEHIYYVQPDGRNLRKVTTNPKSADGQTPPPGFNGFPSWAPDDSKIAFVSTRDDPSPATCDMQDLTGARTAPACVKHIYVMNADGTGLQRVTNGAAQDGHPSWGPTGDQLVFHSNRDGNFRLYKVNVDGSNLIRVTNPMAAPKAPGQDMNPIWIPGCIDRIVFASNRDDGSFAVYGIEWDGSNIIKLTTPVTSTPGQVSNDNLPTWSGLPAPIRSPGPCCTPGLAFDSTRDDRDNKKPEIYVMRGDGSRVTRLTFNPAIDQKPAPSPDGKRIAFESNRGGTFQLFTINVDGSGLFQVTNLPGNVHNAMWSNDSNKLAFDSDHEKNNPAVCGATPDTCRHVYTINVDGTGLQRISNNPTTALSASNQHPAWPLRDDRIAFESNRDGKFNVYVAMPDGSQVTQMTTKGGGHPSFAPETQQIAFESNRVDGQHYHIFVMDTAVDPATGEGKNLVQVTDDDPAAIAKNPGFKGDDREPYWCPTCVDRIVFQSNRENTTPKIYVTGSAAWNTPGKNVVRLTSPFDPAADQKFTEKNFDDLNPAWSGVPTGLLAPAITAPAAAASVPAPAANTGTGGSANAVDSWLSGFTAWVSQFFK